MNIGKMKKDNKLTEIFERANKIGISLKEVTFLIERLERVGLDANAAGVALQKAMKDLMGARTKGEQ